MKNQIIPFFLGILVAISFAASTHTLFTVKPAMPKKVTTKIFNGLRHLDNSVVFIREQQNMGYTLKTLVASDYKTLVIMEKY